MMHDILFEFVIEAPGFTYIYMISSIFLRINFEGCSLIILSFSISGSSCSMRNQAGKASLEILGHSCSGIILTMLQLHLEACATAKWNLTEKKK